MILMFMLLQTLLQIVPKCRRGKSVTTDVVGNLLGEQRRKRFEISLGKLNFQSQKEHKNTCRTRRTLRDQVSVAPTGTWRDWCMQLVRAITPFCKLAKKAARLGMRVY